LNEPGEEMQRRLIQLFLRRGFGKRLGGKGPPPKLNPEPRADAP
jgi:hypothetical protein